MFNQKNYPFNKLIICAPLLLATLVGCTKQFGTSSDPVSSSQALWGGGEFTSTNNSASAGGGTYCTIDIPRSLPQNQPLVVTLESNGLVMLQVNVGDNPFSDIGGTNGTLRWAGNSFPVYDYPLGFRGVKADGTVVPCNPSNVIVSVTEAVTVVQPPAASNPQPAEVMKNFVSLHQFPLRIAKNPAPGSYEYPIANVTSFKNQYNPDDATTGCYIGALKNNECAFPWSSSTTVSLNFTENLIGYNVPKNFRFYIPAGETDVRMSGYAPQRVAHAYVIRMGQPPARTRGLTSAEYSQAQANDNIDTTYRRLAAGEELVIVHDGGGTLRLLSGKLTTQGGWVFVRALDISENIAGMTPGQTMYDVQLGIVAEKNAFINSYHRLSFDAYGDPL